MAIENATTTSDTNATTEEKAPSGKKVSIYLACTLMDQIQAEAARLDVSFSSLVSHVLSKSMPQIAAMNGCEE